MPGRKLNPEQVEELRQGDVELMNNKVIRRRGDDGEELVITTIEQLAAWKGIRPARYHELKRTGWKLKQGIPTTVSAPSEMVPVDVLRALHELYDDRSRRDGARIAELEALVAELERQLKVRT